MQTAEKSSRYPGIKATGTKKYHVLIADDDETSRRVISHFVSKMGYTPHLASDGEECIKKAEEEEMHVLLLDISMPKKDGFDVMNHLKENNITLPVIMVTASHEIPLAVKCIKMGAFEYLTKPVSIERLEIVLRNALSGSQLQHQVIKLQKELKSKEVFHHIIGKSPAIRDTMEQAMQVMETDLNVLILGESGTGKELFAQALHNGSKRKNGPFISVNCAAISNDLADSLLFGHVKGSFTGANNDHTGFFEQADRGTIFLDEIGDMNSDIQAKVLRALQEHKIRKVGEKAEKTVDFRVISATNRDFSEAIMNNQFREDLYFRLEEFPLFIPPLRDRDEDIKQLAKHFLDEFASANNLEPLQFSEEAMASLMEYGWPGNIRELKNAVQRAAVTRKSNVIELLHTPRIHGKSPSQQPVLQKKAEECPPAAQSSPLLSLEDHEREAILKACDASKGNLTRTAKMLGIGRATLYRKLDKFQLQHLKNG
ncbi:MAG: sigma-54-dependent Fis family transcriptional regulator [Chlorobiaceae bacterium]|nr:sigma-54-dependent Fis family transcriptional regulator [Chlorobiaceae bacterium]